MSTLLILTCFRLAFLYLFSTGLSGIAFPEYERALFTGFRLDAKWLATLLAPAFILFLISGWKPCLYKYSAVLAFLGVLCFVILDAVNIGFYDFYKTPINPLIFGLFQDDTKAIFQTIWTDWPVFTYLLVISCAVAVPFLIAYALPEHKEKKVSGFLLAALGIFSTLFYAFLMRGSLEHFPLRQEDLAVSKNTFINSSVINGPSALYEGTKAWRNFQIKGNPKEALTQFGYADKKSAEKDFVIRPIENFRLPFRPNVVFAVMESMSADIFDSHDPVVNNTLGSLETAIADGILFLKGVSIANETFASLQGLVLDSPISPISQRAMGRKGLDFSQVWAFKRAGYRTIFLTGSPESWRQISDTFRFYGFEEIYGQPSIAEKFLNAEKSPWGIGDKWLFKFAEDLLAEAEGTSRPVFIMMLSTTNHPPFKVPDEEESKPVSVEKLPGFINRTSNDGNLEMLLKTYQYAADSLGTFVLDIKKKGWLNYTLIAATGDHNARMKYLSEGVWHHMFRVPVMLWLPDSVDKSGINTDSWVSHRDILPTLVGIATGEDLGNEKGRNLLSKNKEDGAVSFIGWSGQGFVVGKSGMVRLAGKSLVCYNWQDDRLVPADKCTPEQEAMGKEARAQRALSEYRVRTGLMAKPSSQAH